MASNIFMLFSGAGEDVQIALRIKPHIPCPRTKQRWKYTDLCIRPIPYMVCRQTGRKDTEETDGICITEY